MMRIAALLPAVSLPVTFVSGRYQASCQYPQGQWSEGLAPGLIDMVVCALLRQQGKVAEVFKSSCHDGGLGSDLTVTLYLSETGQGVHSEKVTVCHRGGGLFHVLGSDAERVGDVAAILSGIFDGSTDQ